LRVAHGDVGEVIHYCRRLMLLLGDLRLLQRLTGGREVATRRLLCQRLLRKGVRLGSRLIELITALRNRRTGGQQRCGHPN
jgi:hypothetical protein